MRKGVRLMIMSSSVKTLSGGAPGGMLWFSSNRQAASRRLLRQGHKAPTIEHEVEAVKTLQQQLRIAGRDLVIEETGKPVVIEFAGEHLGVHFGGCFRGHVQPCLRNEFRSSAQRLRPDIADA